MHAEEQLTTPSGQPGAMMKEVPKLDHIKGCITNSKMTSKQVYFYKTFA